MLQTLASASSGCGLSPPSPSPALGRKHSTHMFNRLNQLLLLGSMCPLFQRVNRVSIRICKVLTRILTGRIQILSVINPSLCQRIHSTKPLSFRAYPCGSEECIGVRQTATEERPYDMLPERGDHFLGRTWCRISVTIQFFYTDSVLKQLV